MKKQLLLGLLLITGTFWQSANAQTVIWSEDFGTFAANTYANGQATSNGVWTVTNTGANGADAQVWYMSGEECGNAAGACGSVCSNGDASLHIGTAPTIFGDAGASYLAGGGGFFFPETDKRVESPTIDLTGYSGMTLQFNYLEDYVGQGGYDPGDDATLWYFDGIVWAQIDPLAVTPAGCAPQGTWTAFSIALPASADNNPNVKIGFHWFNNDDNVGTDPSIAVDDIEIIIPSTAPTADFTASAVSICEGDCIDFTDLSTLGTNPAWSWTFAGAATGTSTAQNPTGICYPTAGTYDVTLDVTDDNGTDQMIQVGYITVTAAPNAGSDNTGNVCDDNTLDLNTILIGAQGGGTWAETSGTPSGQFNAGTGVLDGTGLTVGNVYTFEYTVNAVAPCTGSDVAVMTITVIDCSGGPLTASFAPSAYNICVGDCITFTDFSTGPITEYSWIFNNGTPGTVGPQATFDPGSVCFNVAGAQDIRLIVSDGTSSDDTTITINVSAPTVNAGSDVTICAGDPVTLTATGTAVSYSWDNGVSDGVPFTPSGTTIYTVTGTDASGCTASDQVTVIVDPCVPLVAGFEYIDNVCVGDCITLTDTSDGVPNQWAWDFGGAATPNTDTLQNPVICLTSAGVFDIQLTVTDASGAMSSTMNQITVFDSPTVDVSAVLGMMEADTLIDLAGSADLIAVGSSPGSILWTPDDNVDCDTCSTTFASPIQDTWYTATITDVNGCSGSDSLIVYVNFIEGIGVPQAFSPNGDGANDILYVKGEGIAKLSFSVYNRYGQKVFETSDQSIGWDGQFHGKDENPGVFTWVLEYTFINGNGGILKGNTTLIR